VVKIPLTPYRFVEPPPGGNAWASSMLWGDRGGYEELGRVPLEVAERRLGLFSPLLMRALAPQTRLLDLGCGVGLDLHLAADEVGPDGQLAGIDLCEERVALARAHPPRGPGVDIRCGDASRLPWPDACFDVVNANCVLSLLRPRAPAVAEAVRVLRAGGALIVSDVVRLAPLDPALARALSGGGNGAGVAPGLDELRGELERWDLTIETQQLEVLGREALMQRARELGGEAGNPAGFARIEALVRDLSDRLALAWLAARKGD
jgi:SAM-dependent methyltransferase